MIKITTDFLFIDSIINSIKIDMNYLKSIKFIIHKIIFKGRN